MLVCFMFIAFWPGEHKIVDAVFDKPTPDQHGFDYWLATLLVGNLEQR